ncbi:MAG: hypothetical protein JKY20_07990 [Alphaproteobacteria bacterium]|nr:hypothetical protein [Alphaproteobacteria bacterium]
MEISILAKRTHLGTPMDGTSIITTQQCHRDLLRDLAQFIPLSLQRLLYKLIASLCFLSSLYQRQCPSNP